MILKDVAFACSCQISEYINTLKIKREDIQTIICFRNCFVLYYWTNDECGVEEDIRNIKLAISKAKLLGNNYVHFRFIHNRYSENRNNQQIVEQEISDLGYNFQWVEAYDNNGVSFATDLIFSLR